MKADRKLYLTADRTRVVEEGDPEAAFLFATPGKEISDADAEKYGLKPAKPAAPAEEKEAAPADNKQAAAPANKARKTAAKKK